MNRAERLEKARGNTVGFALTVLQRRLASSPEAILRSLERRRKRLEKRRRELSTGGHGEEPPLRGRLDDLLGRSLLVAAQSHRSSDYAAMITEVRPRCAGLERVVLIGGSEWDALPVRDGDPETLAAASAALSPDDPINIQYTSGTTGFPKGATLSHHNILNNGFFVGELCGYTEADRICVPVPLYHCFGMVLGNLAATTHGSCLVYPAPAFEPAATLTAVAQERCTSLYGVPTMFIAELALESFGSYDLGSLRPGSWPAPRARSR